MINVFNSLFSRAHTLGDKIYILSILLYSILCVLLYSKINAVIDTIMPFLFVFIVINHLLRNKNKLDYITKTIVVLLLLSIVEYLLFINGDNSSVDYLLYVKGSFICVLYIMIGKDWRLSIETYRILLWVFSITAIATALYVILFNIGGFNVESSYGRDFSKNSFGPLLCYVFIIMLLEQKNAKIKITKILIIGIVLLSFIMICVIRSRTSMVVCGCSFIMFLYKEFMKNKVQFFLFFGVCICAIIVLDALFDFDIISKIFNYIKDAFIVGHEGDITSNRGTRNSEALELINESPLLGNIVIHKQVAWVHNYFLFVLSSWGILGGGTLIILYLFIILLVIKNVFKKNFNHLNIGYFLLLVPLITSLAESTFPLYPGSTIYLAYLSLGFSVKNNVCYEKK